MTHYLKASDYANLQAAVNAAISSNTPLVLDSQSYTLTSTLTADLSTNKGLVLIGDGADIKGNFSGPLIEVTLTGETYAPLRISNLRLNGYGNADGILFSGTNYGGPLNFGLVEGVTSAHGLLKDYLLHFNNFRHVNVRECTGKGNGGSAGLWVTCDDGTFAGDINVYGSEFAADGGRPILIRAENGGSARGIHFKDCYPYTGGSLIEAKGVGSIAGDVYFNGVQWDQFHTGGPALTIHADATGHIDNINIADFYFEGGSSEAILITGDGGQMKNISIANGQIGGITNSAQYAINAWRCDELSISGVQFEDLDCYEAAIGFNKGTQVRGEITLNNCSWPQGREGSVPKSVVIHSARNGSIMGNNLAGKPWSVDSTNFSRVVEGYNLVW